MDDSESSRPTFHARMVDPPASDGVPIRRLEQLETLVEDTYRVGDSVTLTLRRGTDELTATVQLAEAPY